MTTPTALDDALPTPDELDLLVTDLRRPRQRVVHDVDSQRLQAADAIDQLRADLAATYEAGVMHAVKAREAKAALAAATKRANEADQIIAAMRIEGDYLRAAVTRLTEREAGLVRDAERYRWLRDVWWDEREPSLSVYESKDLDAIIDAAQATGAGNV